MQSTIAQQLQNISPEKDRRVLQTVLEQIASKHNTTSFVSAGLVIKAGGSVLAMSSASVIYRAIVRGKLVSIATSTDMPSLLGINITAARFNVVCFFIDSGSTVTAVPGIEATTAALVTFPDFPVGKALVGFLLITHSSTFTGNTTALDTATTLYFSPVGPFDPSLIYS
jgi:hypothetical protein